MEFVLVFLFLVVLEIAYFKIADKYNIIDKPNDRSSHDKITLRGGGVIFYFGALCYFIVSGYQYPFFFLGLTLMAVISFIDDILTLSSRVRLIVHFTSVLLMVYQLDLFSLTWYFLIIGFVIIVGVINAYNFMDGINGITASYSLSVLILLILVNSKLNFIDSNFLVYSLIAVLVFSIFNFRMNAKTFAGDVGSVSIAYIILFALALLIIKTGNFIYILFLTIYGIDAIWTIIRRLWLKENIFEAHRSHLYQFLVNEVKINKLLVSFLYGLIQFLIGICIIYIANFDFITQVLFSIVLITILSVVYLILKNWVIKRFVKKSLV